MAAELAQHVGAVAVGLGEIDVADERGVEGLQRVLDLALPVQRLADQIVRARLPRLVAERAAGEIDALLELALLAGDHGDVIERVGVLRVVAQHLGIAVHGQRHLARAVVDQALLDEFGVGWPFERASKQGCGAMPSLNLRCHARESGHRSNHGAGLVV